MHSKELLSSELSLIVDAIISYLIYRKRLLVEEAHIDRQDTPLHLAYVPNQNLTQSKDN